MSIVTIGSLPHRRNLPPAEAVRQRLLALLPNVDDARRHRYRGEPWRYSELRRRVGGHHSTDIFRQAWDQLLLQGQALELWVWNHSGQPHHLALAPQDFTRFDWGTSSIVQVRGNAEVMERLGLSRLDRPF